jgi:hypothetical protein
MHGVRRGKATLSRKAEGVRYLSPSTGITQNISDLLKSQAAETIFSNSSLVVMLNQAPGDRAALARLLNISETQQQYISNARKGSGLIWTGQAIIPFMDEFPQNTRLYEMMSTNATESLAESVANERASRPRQEMSQKEQDDQEYAEYQEQQSQFYQDKQEVDGQQNPYYRAPEPEKEQLRDAFDKYSSDMDDYPDNGFGPDPFAVPFSQGGFNKNETEDDDVDDDTLPNEFDTNFGGGVNSMFNSMPKPAQSSAQTKNTKNKDALDSFFNI